MSFQNGYSVVACAVPSEARRGCDWISASESASFLTTGGTAPEGEEASAGGSPKVADPNAEGADIAMEGAS